MPSTSPEDREAKRLRLLMAAATEFAECGFDDTSIEKIAERAKIGKGTVYNYTRSKEQLFSECLQLFCEELVNLFEITVLGDTGLTALQRIPVLSEKLADLADRRKDFVTLFFRSIFGASSVQRDLAAQSAREIISGIERLMVQGQGAGIVRKDAPAVLMASMVFMNRLIFSRMLDSLELLDHTHEEQALFLYEVHWRGFKNELAL